MTKLPQARTCSDREPSSGVDTIYPAIESLNAMSTVCHSAVSDSCDPMDCSPQGSSVHGISQARILEWVAISFPRESSLQLDSLLSDSQGIPLNQYCEVFQHIPELSIMEHSLSSQVPLHSTVYQNFLCSGSPDSSILFTLNLLQTGLTLHGNYLGWPKSFFNIFPKILNEAFGQPSTWYDHVFLDPNSLAILL